MLTLIKNYFSEEGSPFNLAFFRIVFFLFILVYINPSELLWFSHLPKALMFPPVGMKHILSVMPVTPFWSRVLLGVFAGSCFIAMVGWQTQWSCLLAALSGIYVLGLPDFFGKVDHNHHLIWFMLILSASRCADAWSVDSFKRAPPGPSVEYALPLRFIWLLIGEIYFFPGLWKLLTPQWAWSDNLKYQIWYQWHFHPGWAPLARLDQYPWLYKISGSMVIFFELSFIFLVLSPRLRPMAVVAGIVFHIMNGLILRLNFFHLQICYVSFINWAALFPHAKGRRERPGQGQALRKRLLVWTGALLLSVNGAFGILKIVSGWPFACYPTFSRKMTEPRLWVITLYGVSHGQEVLIDMDKLKQHMLPQRFELVLEKIFAVRDPIERKQKLQDLTSLMRGENIDLKNYSRLRFYWDLCSTRPDQADDPPLARRFLKEIDL